MEVGPERLTTESGTTAVAIDGTYGGPEQYYVATQAALFRTLCSLTAAAAAGLTLRELIVGGPAHEAALGVLLGLGMHFSARRFPRAFRPLAALFFVGLVALVTLAALDMGGAAGSALCFGFIPGFLAVLVLGPAAGWAVCALMLGCFGWLYETTALASRDDFLRFVDEAAMAVFGAGLAHTLVRTFARTEAAIGAQQSKLLALKEARGTLTTAIYEELDPLSARLAALLDTPSPVAARDPELASTLDKLIGGLSRAKSLAKKADAEVLGPRAPDSELRVAAFRVWLRLCAGLMLFFVARNVLVGAPYAPSVISVVSCIVFAAWLACPAALRHLEATGLAVGVAATVPMVAHVYAYGATPTAPPLVVTPVTVLFSALLSTGPATWATVALNLGVLAWVGAGRTLTLLESRLLGDLALCFVVVVVALRSVFALRRRYAVVLERQGQAVAGAMAQQRRLAGTLFHDVSNHLQTLLFFSEDPGAFEAAHARALSLRVRRLITLSKDFLLDSRAAAAPILEPVALSSVVALLVEAFGPRLDAKQQELVRDDVAGLSVLAQPDLLVESVLGNLLSNAIKFSPRGSAIRLTAEARGPLVCIQLADSGPGLPAEATRELGAEGALPTRPGTGGERGQGYGLKLAHEHLQRMGGRLELAARSGGGTEASVWLPRA